MAPSRRKKVLRDSIVTRAFFNQGDSGSCSCGIALSHNHATTSLNTGDPDHSKLADPGRGKDSLKCLVIETNYGTGDEILEDEISSIWIPNFLKLSPQAQQAAYAASTMQPPVSESTQVLKLAYKQMSDDPAKADQFNSMDTFDLNNLHGVAKGYDKLSKTYKDKEESEMADLAGLVGDLAVTASDAKRTSDDRLAAELDMQNLNIYSKITVPLNSCLRQVQLFNIEKRFGFVEEEYQALCNNDKKQHGEDVPAQLPLSFRQQLENPFKPPEPTSESSKKEDKKKLSGLDALVELQRNFKLVTEEFQDLKKIVSDAEKPIELPGLPASFTYRNVPVPEDIPNHIRQRFFDVDFAHQEVVLLRQQASNQILCVKSGIAIWYNTSHEVWYVQLNRFP